MKGWVYMIDYKEFDDDIFMDQIECNDKQDLLEQVKMIANNVYGENLVVVEIKLVNDNQRDCEKDISDTLFSKCKKILGIHYGGWRHA